MSHSPSGPNISCCSGQVFHHLQDASSSQFTRHVNVDTNLVSAGLGFPKGTLRSLSLRDESLWAGLLGTGV